MLDVSIEKDPLRTRGVTVVGEHDPCALLARKLRDELAARGLRRAKAS